MERLLTLLQGPTCQHLVAALLHTLWQGAIMAVVLFAALRRLSARQVNQRYACALGALCLVLLSGFATWSILNYEPVQAVAGAPVASLPGETVQTPGDTASHRSPDEAGTSVLPAPARQPWQTWALGTWLLGCIVMLLRMAMTLVGARQLRRQSYRLEQGDILSLVESLCAQMQIKRTVPVFVSEHLSVPGVIGCIWPTLLLPVSVTTGMPIEDLKAILTHELNHIKRYDYLVNVFQMVIEALLFFNPAVWWISRQIRVEREACCDAASIAFTGQRLKYAEVLVAWSARLREEVLAPSVVGFAGPENNSTVVDRIKRITLAGHRPRLNISWPMAGVTIGLSLLCLVGLWQGTNLAVSVGARILTPQERIEQIKEIAKDYGYEPGRDPKEHSIQVSGVIRTWDGSPLPDKIKAVLDVEYGEGTYLKGIGTSKLDTKPDTAEFRTRVARGQFWFMASAEGYATAAMGPLEAQPGNDISDIELVLQKGFSGKIQVVNEAGDPIEQASLKGGYTFEQNQSYSHTIELSTDAQGRCTQEHASGQTMTLKVTASGYAPKTVQHLVMDPQNATVIVLQKAQPITGTVVSRATGLPIANAEIRLLMLSQKHRRIGEGYVENDPDTRANEQGIFSLEQVRQGWQHMIHVTAQGYGHIYLEDVPAGKQGLRIELGDKKIIRGQILGDLSQLDRDPSGRPAVTFLNGYTGYGAHSGMAPVTSQGDIKTFEINDVWGQTVTLKAGYKEITLTPEIDNLDNLVINLSSDVTRDVVLQFEVPPDMPPIQGEVRIYRVTQRSGRYIRSKTDWVRITENQASFRSSAPGQFRYNIDYNRKRPVGYWVGRSEFIDVPTGAGSLVIKVPVHPAGAIYGTITRPDGTRAKDGRASLVVVQRPDNLGRGLYGLTDVLNRKLELGTFNATPLPLGGTYAIMAYEGYAFAISEPFTLDQATPMVKADLQLPRGVTVSGRLVDESGKPATNPLSLHISVKRGESSSGLSGVEIQPDEQGRFVFENVNPGPNGSCAVRVLGQTGYRPVRQEIKDLRKPVIIELERGKRILGTVINRATGGPAPDLEVYAQSVKNAQGDYARNSELLEADSKTNTQGQFEFSNMGSGFYRLGVRGADLAGPKQPVIVTGGQQRAVALSVTLPSWSN